jgi:hypothetical protein
MRVFGLTTCTQHAVCMHASFVRFVSMKKISHQSTERRGRVGIFPDGSLQLEHGGPKVVKCCLVATSNRLPQPDLGYSTVLGGT